MNAVKSISFGTDSLSWRKSRLSLMIAVSAVLAFFLLETLLNVDGAGFLYFFLIGPATTIVLIVIASHRRVLEAWIVAAAFWLIFITFFLASHEVRAVLRWLFVSESYRTTLESQAPPRDGTLRHAKWDGSGFADNITYLVLDPERSLSRPAMKDRYEGLPCPVYGVHHLWNSLYYVEFYTDTSWDRC